MLEKIFLVICVQDSKYQEALVRYIRDSEHTANIVAKFFSNQQNLENYMQSEEPVHILMAEADMLPEQTDRLMSCTVVKLVDEEGESDDRNTLYKYQPLNKIFLELLSKYAEDNPDSSPKFKRDRKTKIISYYSSSGGVGKTAVALASCHILSRSNRKTLYLNLEAVHGIPFLQLDGKQEGLSHALYYMRNNQKQFGAKFEAIKKVDDILQMDYVRGSSNIRDVMELSDLDARRMLQIITEMGGYDYIVVDLDCSIHERNIGVLQESDYVFWILSDDVQSFRKTQLLLHHLQRMNLSDRHFFENTYFVVNKFLGEMVNNGGEINISSYLPYIPQWKTGKSIYQYIVDKHFNQYLHQMLSSFVMVEEKSRI